MALPNLITPEEQKSTFCDYFSIAGISPMFPS
jgi:hypothetical protein